MATVAVIGVGRLGLAVTERLAAAGHAVRACDVRGEVAAQLPAGAGFFVDPLEAVRGADALLTALPGSPELRAVMLDSGGTPGNRSGGPPACGGVTVGGGMLAGLAGETTWIDLTSTAPDLGAELAAAARERGIGYLDAPVGGGPEAVRSGTATVYVGGEASVLNAQHPLLVTFANRVEHMGPNGAGYLAKLLVNLLWFGQALATGEALLIARRGGLDLGRFAEALTGSAASGAFVGDYVPRLLAGDYAPQFGLDRCVEELDSIERLAAQLGLPAELTRLVARVHRDALARFGLVDGELLAVAHLEAEAGTSLTSHA